MAKFKTYILVDAFDSAFLERLRAAKASASFRPTDQNPWYGYADDLVADGHIYWNLDLLCARCKSAAIKPSRLAKVAPNC